MKKLIAISVILVLLTAVAFAETSVSGAVIVKGTLAGGTTQETYPSYLKDGDAGYTDWKPEWYDTEYENPNLVGLYSGANYSGIKTGFEFKRLRLQLDTTNDEGTFGGRLRSDFGGFNGFVWWKPIEVLKVQLGEDTDYGAVGSIDGGSGYGFYGAANDVGFTGGSFGASFFGGWPGAGLSLFVTPIEALSITIGVPLGTGNGDNWGALAEYTYKKTIAQVAYTIDGIGKVGITYVGGIGHKDAEKTTTTLVNGNPFWKTDPKAPDSTATSTPAGISGIPAKGEINDPSKIYAAFILSAIENLGVDVGVGYGFGYTFTGDTDVKDDDYTVKGKLSVGLGAQYDAGAFGVKLRVEGNLLGGGTQDKITLSGGGQSVEAKLEVKDPLTVIVDVLPYYAVSDAVKIYLDAGMVFAGAAERTYTATQAGYSGSQTERLVSTLDWHANPYITYSAGSGTFYAGIRLDGTGKRSSESESTGSPVYTYDFSNSYVSWAVPIGFTLSF